MDNFKIGLKLKLISIACLIEKSRSESLYAVMFDYVEIYSRDKDMDRLSFAMLGMTQRANELHFMCSSFDSILKKYYKAPLRARAVLVTELKRTIRPFLIP